MSTIAPPYTLLSLTIFRLSRNTSNPSNWLISVLVNLSFPWRFKSINKVSTKSPAGIGWGFFSENCTESTWKWLFLRERDLSVLSWPISCGRETITLSSKINSVSNAKLPMSGGTKARLLFDRSSFFSGNLGLHISLGMDVRWLPCKMSVFNFGGKDGKLWFAGFIRRFFPRDKVISLSNVEIVDNDMVPKRFSSQLRDFSSFKCDILSRLFILFLDRSSVRREVNLA